MMVFICKNLLFKSTHFFSKSISAVVFGIWPEIFIHRKHFTSGFLPIKSTKRKKKNKNRWFQWIFSNYLLSFYFHLPFAHVRYVKQENKSSKRGLYLLIKNPGMDLKPESESKRALWLYSYVLGHDWLQPKRIKMKITHIWIHWINALFWAWEKYISTIISGTLQFTVSKLKNNEKKHTKNLKIFYKTKKP